VKEKACNKETPLLSILIPTRNRAKYLKYAIQSALNVPSDKIEIIVSENYSSDNSWDVCNSFSDLRLRVCRPDKPLPMHENWEFLLQESCGEWVIFIGDDDAIMPHCVEHLLYLTSKYPHAEAIVSPRAYYFWDGCQQIYGQTAVSYSFKTGEKWQDSKKKLDKALTGELDYICLPQMYSGGFHRRSLINRVLRTQNGIYFKSVTPDAYTALMACVHTYRYLETGIPMTWVGNSPHCEISQDKQAKDRKADFFGMHDEDSLTMHNALGSLEEATFSLYFFEAYISAFPVTSYTLLSMQKVEELFYDAVHKLRKAGNESAAIKLGQDLGFDLPKSNLIIFLIGSVKRIKEKIVRIFMRCLKSSCELNVKICKYYSQSHQDHPDILSCDNLLRNAYEQFVSFTSDS